MDEQLRFTVDLVAALSIALAGGWVAARIGLSPIIGYVAAGMVISPATPGFVGDIDRLRLLADVGVILLMFGIGVQFSLRHLVRSGRSVGGLAAMQIAVTMALGYGAGLAFGWDSLEALFFGAAVALSSSTVLVKLIGERGEEESAHGRTAVTWSIVQDLATIVLVVILGVAAEDDMNAGDLALTALKVVGFVGGVLVLGFRAVPWALDQIAAVRSREIFLLAIASLALGTAAAASAVGISLALGAFLAGLVVSESERSHQVLGEVLPIRDVFAVLFFVAMGMLIDPGEIGGGAHILLVALLLIVIVKLALTAGPLAGIGVPLRTAALTGALLAQSAEFSFVILDVGVSEGAVSEEVFSLTLTAAAISILLTPAFVKGAARAPAGPLRPTPEPLLEQPEEVPLAHHIVVIGYRAARHVVDLLRRRGFQVVVVDEEPGVVEELRAQGITCFQGMGANEAILRRLNLPRARLLVLAEPDPILAELAVHRARTINPSLAVIARAVGPEDRSRLISAGVRQAVMPEEEAALELARVALSRMGVSSQEVAAVIQRLRLGQ